MHELKVLIGALEASTSLYEDRQVTIKDSPTEHLRYLKEKALLTKYSKRLKDYNRAYL